ncbi:MAG: glutathione S-transferase N-terminal domain-containing protein [Nanoarchaeota archaeon]|nr:glutathione S-transferase N-terminal domain-containing protein [Nanoarchaeota archaeon]
MQTKKTIKKTSKTAKKTSKVTVYSTPTCPWCIRAKMYLKEKGIKFTELDVAKDDKAREELIEKSGQMGVPVIDIDGKIIIGFDQEAIDKELGI